MKTTHYYIAPISNATSRPDRLELGPGFRVELWKYGRTTRLLSELLRLPDFEVDVELQSSNCFLTQKNNVFAVCGEFELEEPKPGDDDSIYRWHQEMDSIFHQIDLKFLLIRLCLGGNIRPYGHFIYRQYNKKLDLCSSVQYSLLDTSHSTEISLQSSRHANSFIQSTDYPIKPDYLQFAVDNFEFSKDTHAIHLQFLCLMIALESIFNVGENELTYRVSRNAAILLGDNVQSSERIMREIQSLYKKRSILVHTGKTNTINQLDIIQAETYVRNSILKLLPFNLTKDVLSKSFTASGFGHWRV